MKQSTLDTKDKNSIMTVEEVARYLHRSESWVYKHWHILGGRKLGGSLFFPTEEDLYERLFSKEERMEVRNHNQRGQVHEGLVPHKGGGAACRRQRERR